jgi:hypothetical protein
MLPACRRNFIEIDSITQKAEYAWPTHLMAKRPHCSTIIWGTLVVYIPQHIVEWTVLLFRACTWLWKNIHRTNLRRQIDNDIYGKYVINKVHINAMPYSKKSSYFPPSNITMSSLHINKSYVFRPCLQVVSRPDNIINFYVKQKWTHNWHF